MTAPRLRHASALTCALAVLTSACSPGGQDDGPPAGAGPVPSATYAAVECPQEVTVATVGDVGCGTLTVPENRTEGTGTVRLFASTLEPPGGQVSGTPILVLGLDTAFNYGGIAPLAQRTRSTVILLEPRGVSHSVPSLACDPEVPPVTWRDRTGSPRWRRSIATWAEDCADSLSDQGIDVASYGVEDMAADAIDLLDALDVGQANLLTYGSGSRVALEIMRNHSNRLRAVVLDTPELPGVDHRRYAATRTRTALEQVLSWCEADLDCRKRYSDPTTLLDRALERADAKPLSLRVAASAGPEPVVLDAALVVRLARQTVTDGGSVGPWALPTALPALLTAVVTDRRGQLTEAANELLGWQGPLCPGYRPKCSPAHTVAEGTATTVLCGDVATTAARRDSGVALPGFREAYDEAWWWGQCDSWPVEPGASAGPVTSEVPTLVFAGGLADIPLKTVRDELAGLENSSVVAIPTQAHNVIGSGCTLELRDQWLRDLQPVPNDLSCIDQRLEW